MKQRIAMLDNLRALLIVLVVVGHVLRRIYFLGSPWLYLVIYSFHMPAMVFLSGLCFRKGRTSVWKTTLLPYLIFQVIYLAEVAWESGTAFTLQFHTPEWILWYLLSLASWQMIVNVIDLRSIRPLLISVICALLLGFDSGVGYFFSLSRTVCFLPFFLAGAYIRENCYDAFLAFFQKKRTFPRTCLLLIPAAITQLLLLLQHNLCENYFFYFANPYDGENTIFVRLMIMIAAASAILTLCVIIPKRELPFVTYLGRNTLPVYMMHGVLLKVFIHLGGLSVLPVHALLQGIFMTLALVLLPIAPPVMTLFHLITFQTEKIPHLRK